MAELAMVEGTLHEGGLHEGGSAQSTIPCDRPGNLGPIAEALDLPVIAVVSCRDCDRDDFHLPSFPACVEGVVLVDLPDMHSLGTLKRLIRLSSGVPVLGAIESMPQARSILESLPRDRHLPQELIDALGRAFLRNADLDALDRLSRSRPIPELGQSSLLSGRNRRSRFRLAYARDEAFGRYFPDTIEALEALGADLIEFSPLRDEALPDDVDLVMVGCGFPDHHAEELASNLSMIASLRQHVCRGQRIYSEGGGTAYLGRRMVIDGRVIAGAGILPFDAVLLPDAKSPEPATRTLLHDCWLGPKGTVVRGYKSSRWQLVPTAQQFECPSSSGSLSTEGDWFFHHHAVGGLLHLHLGALPEFVTAFASPHRPSLKRPSRPELGERELDHARGRDEDHGAIDPLNGPDA
jgi:cobyrinic acid a,c-diamide synthase